MADVLKVKPPEKLPTKHAGEEKMSDVAEIHGPGLCEATVCQRELKGGDRTFRSADDHVRVRDKSYHKGCEPTPEELAAKDRA